MRRIFLIVTLVGALGLGTAACSSDTTTSTGGQSNSAQAGDSTGTTKKAGNPGVAGPKCQAVKSMLQALLAVKQTDPTKKQDPATLNKNIDAALDKVTKNLPNLTADANTMAEYMRKIVSGQTPTAAEEEAANKAKDKFNFYNNSNCKEDSPGPKFPTTSKP